MKPVVSVKDLEELLRSGKDVRALPTDALLTPSARDFLRDLEGNGSYKAPGSGDGGASTPAKPVTSKSSKSELEA
ncbi:MAG: hypothetical protein DME25_18830, partial [Verrucomicrobia bacterium]